MRKVTGLRCLYAAVAAVALGLSAERVSAQEEAPLPATPTPPPDVQEREKVAKPPAPPARSPGLEELVEKVRKQRGGEEKLERARRDGARIPAGRGGGAALESSPVLDLSSSAEQQNVMKATRAAPEQSVAGVGNLYVIDFSPRQTSALTMWGPYHGWASSWPITGNFDMKPFVSASVQVVSTGWYLINFAAVRGKASLRKAGPTSGTPAMYPLLAQWDNSASASPWESYPHVVNLAAGYHYFYWVPDPHWYFYVSEVTVTKL
jgi:hypothetical protein